MPVDAPYDLPVRESSPGRSYGTVSLLRLGRYWSGFPLRRWHGGAPEATRWAYGHLVDEWVPVIVKGSIRHHVAAMRCQVALRSSSLSQHSAMDSPSQRDHSESCNAHIDTSSPITMRFSTSSSVAELTVPTFSSSSSCDEVRTHVQLICPGLGKATRTT